MLRAGMLIACLPWLIACADGVAPEVTRGTLGPDLTTLRSADGLLEIRAANDPPVEVVITATDEPGASTRISRGYRLEPAGLLLQRGALRLKIADRASPGELVAAIETAGQVTVLPDTRHLPAEQAVLAPLSRLTGETYGAHEVDHQPCRDRQCGEGCSVCSPSDPDCLPPVGSHFCDPAGACRAGPFPACDFALPPGWDDPPASGRAWITRSLLFDSQAEGFDLDGVCGSPGYCGDGVFSAYAAVFNDQLRQGLLGGETLLGLEIAGLPAGGEGPATLKLYGVRDRDDPFFPANNFGPPPGETQCCEFNISPQAISGDPPQSGSRIPIVVTGETFRSIGAASLSLVLTVGAPPHPRFRMERVWIRGRISDGMLSEVVWSGAFTAPALAQICNPYCRTANPACPVVVASSTLLDLFAWTVRPQPDIDLDGDGLETLLDTDGDGLIDLCHDGCSAGCSEPPRIADVAPGERCVHAPQIADGYSATFTLEAVPATFYLPE
jgi:hypothetical protein